MRQQGPADAYRPARKFFGVACSRLYHLLFPLAMLLLVTACSGKSVQTSSAVSSAAPGQTPQMVRDDWPRKLQEADTQFTIYQPQLESWTDDKIIARVAIAVQDKGSASQQYGVAWFSARTEVDKKTRMVLLQDFAITKTNFPKASEKGQQYTEALKTALPRQPVQISLDRLQTELEMTSAGSAVKTAAVSNAPPRIIFSTVPALLVIVDGKPVLAEMKGSEYKRVINTGVLLCAHTSGSPYYLWLADRWVQAPSLDGTWSSVASTPAALETVKKELVNKVDLLENMPPDVKQSLQQGKLPALFVSTVPAYLLQTKGEPEFVPIPGTTLRYASNSSDDIIYDMKGLCYFVLIAGRWFQSISRQGPWTFVNGPDLPPDFARIPPDCPMARVLAAVPGTPQAKQAVVAATTPQTATVKRSATGTVTYDGQPQFKPIDGTPLHQAVNASAPVIRVDASTYYMVDKGIWFCATSPLGPWAVATVVPQVIYSIPPSSPLHYVTYVHVYGSTQEVVYTGYTQGYNGAMITPANTVVYGTGYIYPSWAASTWYPASPAYYYYYDYDDYDHYHSTYDGKYIERGYAGDTHFTQVGDTTFARNDGDLYATRDGELYQRELGGWKQYDPESGDWELTTYSKVKDIKKIQEKRGGSADKVTAYQQQQGRRSGSTDQTSGSQQGRLGSRDESKSQDRARELDDSFRSRAEGERRASASRTGRVSGGSSPGSGRFGGGGFGGGGFGRGGFGGRGRR